MEVVPLPDLTPVAPRGLPVEVSAPRRTPDAVNANNVRDAIKGLMRDLNYDPFKEMILIAKSLDTPLKVRATMASELAQYIAPKLKGLDIDSKHSGSISVVIQKFADEIMLEATPPTIELENLDDEPSQLIQE